MAATQPDDARIEAMLTQLSRAANLGISPEELLTRAMDGLLQVSRAPAGVACVADPERRTLQVISIRGVRPAVSRTFPRAFQLEAERGSEQLIRPIRIGEEEFPGLEELHAGLRAEGIAGGILLPLSSEGRLLGLLMAMYRAGGEPAPILSDSALRALQRGISTALDNARVRHGLQSLNRDLLRLLTLAKILAEPRELEDTLTVVAQAAKSFAGAAATVVWLAEPAAKRLTRIVSLEPEGPERYPRLHLAYGEGIAGWVAQTGETLYLDEALGDPRLFAKEWARNRGLRSVYSFPLRFKEELEGVLSVWTAAPLAPPHLSLLTIYSDHAALALGHARLLRDNEAQAEQLSSLMAAARGLNERKSPREQLGLISEACRRATGASWFSVWRADDEARELRLLYADPASHGLPDRQERVGYGAGLVGWAALHRAARITPDVRAEPLASDLDWYRRFGIVASVVLPLIVDSRLVGVLQVGAPASPGAEQLRLVEGYAAVAAISLAHAST